MTHPPRQLQPWLVDTGSLTARLLAKSNGNFYVRVVRQVIARPSLSEQQALNMKQHQLALIREVVLYGNNEPWVFARSVLPLSSLTGSLRHLRKQGTKPLGAFLFSQPHLHRGPMHIAAITARDAYVPKNFIGQQPLWGRRSVFSIAHKPLLVSEVFLQAFCTQLT